MENINLPQRIIDRLEDGKMTIGVETADLRGDCGCRGLLMDHQIGRTQVELWYKFTSPAYTAVRVLRLERVRGVMVSHIVGYLAMFDEEIRALGHDGRYEVEVDEWDEDVDWAAVYAPYQGQASSNGRY